MFITRQGFDDQGSSIAEQDRNTGHTASLCIPVEGSDVLFHRVGVREGGYVAGRAKSARVMPGDLSRGQFVIVCQPLYTVNTTNCRLIQMRSAHGARTYSMPIRLASRNAPRLKIPSCTRVKLLIRLINLVELLRPPSSFPSLNQLPIQLRVFFFNFACNKN